MANNKLSTSFVKRHTKKGRYGDGEGLWLSISTSGSKSWVFQYTVRGKERQYGMGSLSALPLANARIEASRLRIQVKGGLDPIAERAKSRRAAIVDDAKRVTFKEAAADYIDAHASGWKNAKSKDQWTASLETYAYPTIGNVDVADIDTAMILKVLRPIWSEKPDTAGRVRGRIKSILDAEKAKGNRTGDNPAAWSAHLEKLLPALADVKKKNNPDTDDGVVHMPALPYDQLPAFMAALGKRRGLSARALEVLILTATRTGSLIGIQDSEVDFKAKVWKIPGSRMKGKPFTVPLTDKAIAILQALPREKNNPHFFAGVRRKRRASHGSHLSNAALLAVMQHAAPAYVPHGFRSSFSDWAAETTNFEDFVIDKALSHTIKSKTKRAYRRGDALDKRRELLTAWEAFLYPGEKK
jgi:integrase